MGRPRKASTELTLKVIKGYWKRERHAPTVTHVAVALGVSVATANMLIRVLRETGKLDPSSITPTDLTHLFGEDIEKGG